MFDPLELARQAVDYYIRSGKIAEPPADLPERFREPSGAFVCIKIEGRLRGCVGTFSPTRPTLAEEIVASSIKAATQDHRFSPLTFDELDSLQFSVDVLDAPEPVSGPAELDYRIYGVIVRAGGRLCLRVPARNLLALPEGVDFELQRFRVIRYGE